MSYYLMYRGWMDNELFERDTHNWRTAWVWLIENAAFSDTKDLKRGQLRVSLRFLAKAWGWQEPRVRRHLARAESCGMIVCVGDAGRTLITICNYDRYQVRTEIADAPPDALPTHIRRTADANYKEGKKEEDTEANASVGQKRVLTRSIDKPFAEWWEGYPHKVGKGTARKAFAKALSKTSLDQLIAGVTRYKASKPMDREWCHPATWLNGERWLDQPAAANGASNGTGSHATVPISRSPTKSPDIFEVFGVRPKDAH